MTVVSNEREFFNKQYELICPVVDKLGDTLGQSRFCCVLGELCCVWLVELYWAMIRMMKSRGTICAESVGCGVEGKCMHGFSVETAGIETTWKTLL